MISLVVVGWLVVPLGTLWAPRNTNHPLWSICTFMGAVGVLGLALGSQETHLPARFVLDNLAAWFLVLIGVIALTMSFYLPGYLRHLRGDLRIMWLCWHVLLASMAMVVLAADAITFLIVWELMSLSSFLLVAIDHQPAATRQAAMIYLGATRIGTAFLAGGFLWVHALTHTWRFADWHLTAAQSLGPGLLLLIGLGVKAGMWPFHLWLPIAHPAAPAPVSALMSGVMVKVAVYAMMRFFLVPLHNGYIGAAILALGAISAFWGVAFALLQHELKRLLAYHTVENVGLILMGLGAALVAPPSAVAQLALAAALFHTLNHGVLKSLLFLGAGAVHVSARTRDLEHLGGLGKRMPITFACFLLGSAAICALPPLNGFASEWLLYQTAIHYVGTPGERFVALLCIGWIGLIGALALACFVKACGVTFLGNPRSSDAARAEEATRGMLAAQVSLAVLCAALGLLAPVVLWKLQGLAAFLNPSMDVIPWSLPTAQLAVILVLTLAVGATWMRRAPARVYITWECGFGRLGPRMQATATSFVQPIARIFSSLFRYAVHMRMDGPNRLFPQEIEVHPEARGGLESSVYRPLLRVFDRFNDMVVRLQAGSIHLYLLTMFLTLLVLMYLGGRP